jgi:hypothetical protein
VRGSDSIKSNCGALHLGKGDGASVLDQQFGYEFHDADLVGRRIHVILPEFSIFL